MEDLMDQLDDLLAEYFSTSVAPGGLAARIAHVRKAAPAVDLDRFRIEANDRGVQRVTYGTGGEEATRGGRRHAARARQELGEYLEGRRAFFTVPVDLTGI